MWWVEEECIFIAVIVSFGGIWDRLEPAGNDAAFKWFGFEWQMLHKINYPQEDENTFHLPFQSTFGLFFPFIYPLVCWETCLFTKANVPNWAAEILPAQENKFLQVIFTRLVWDVFFSSRRFPATRTRRLFAWLAEFARINQICAL